MKNNLYLLGAACTVVVLLAACTKNVESVTTEDNNGLVYITASIDPETKSTLNDGTGAFAFSSGDAIMVRNNSGAFSGTTTSTGNSGTFAMAAGFDGGTDGIAGFPASLVSAMTSSTVTFTLPTTYEYSEVGSGDPVDKNNADANTDAANAAKVPCPMIGSYDGATKIVTLKQAGSVVRFRLTNVAAGTLSFSFSSNVTGKVKPLSAIASVEDKGILADNFIIDTYSHPGSTITVTGVPTVDKGQYIYITLPVPTETAPNDILVVNNTKMLSLTGSSDLLSRAGGYKLSVAMPDEAVATPTFKVAAEKKVVLAPGNLIATIGEFHNVDATTSYATPSSWRFGGYLETIGDSPERGNYKFSHHDSGCVGKEVDLFEWQGSSVDVADRHHGLVVVDGASTYTPYLGSNGAEDVLYSGCWNGLEISNNDETGWRVLNYDEWHYILFERATTTGKEYPLDDIRFARVKVAGVCGLLIFPDDSSIAWKAKGEGGLGLTVPADYNGKIESALSWDNPSQTTVYTSSDLINMINNGFAFLPAGGTYVSGTVFSVNTLGYYWTSTGSADSATRHCAWYVQFMRESVAGLGAWSRGRGQSVRLARDVVE